MFQNISKVFIILEDRSINWNLKWCENKCKKGLEEMIFMFQTDFSYLFILIL